MSFLQYHSYPPHPPPLSWCHPFGEFLPLYYKGMQKTVHVSVHNSQIQHKDKGVPQLTTTTTCCYWLQLGYTMVSFGDLYLSWSTTNIYFDYPIDCLCASWGRTYVNQYLFWDRLKDKYYIERCVLEIKSWIFFWNNNQGLFYIWIPDFPPVLTSKLTYFSHTQPPLGNHTWLIFHNLLHMCSHISWPFFIQWTKRVILLKTT